MKVHELLESQEPANTIEAIRALIQRDCKPFLQVAKRPLFRGQSYNGRRLNDVSPPLYICAVRNDRRPKDTNTEIHDALNKMFTGVVGLPLRSTSLFCTPDYSIASQYMDSSDDGPAALIFPIGEFHYAWSPKIQDAYSTFEELNGTEIYNLIAKAMGTKGLDEFFDYNHEQSTKVILKVIEKFGPSLYKFDSGLAQATKNEIMVVCDKYYALFADNSADAKRLWKKITAS